LDGRLAPSANQRQRTDCRQTTEVSCPNSLGFRRQPFSAASMITAERLPRCKLSGWMALPLDLMDDFDRVID